ncbi:MAG: class I SAM-dependent methyltransferase [Chloroflexota bacterium]
MPTSPWNSITPIMDIVMGLSPRPDRILDVGIGFGKYGFLCREYLSYWNLPDIPRQMVIDGIEAFPDYAGDLQRGIYDELHLGDALGVLEKMPPGDYDLVLLIDVIEHFSRDAGLRLLGQCRRVGKAVIVSTPRRFWPQEAAWDNPWEVHKSLWSRADLRRAGAVRIIKQENWIAVFAAPPYREYFSLRCRLWKIRQRLLRIFTKEMRTG